MKSVYRAIPVLGLGLVVMAGCDAQVGGRSGDVRTGDSRTTDRDSRSRPEPRTVPPAAPSGQASDRTQDDATITSQVKAKLSTAEASGLREVGVQTEGGVVRLEGVVATPDAKNRASELARQVAGVRDVVNNLRVQG